MVLVSEEIGKAFSITIKICISIVVFISVVVATMYHVFLQVTWPVIHGLYNKPLLVLSVYILSKMIRASTQLRVEYLHDNRKS